MKNIKRLLRLIVFIVSWPFGGLYVNFDNGRGDSDKWLYMSLGGSGLRRWWTSLNRGPGGATGPGEYKSKKCGHAFPFHCNSAYCGALWCGAQRWPVFGRVFVLSYNFRLWCGPTYNRLSFKNWKLSFNSLKRKDQFQGHGSSTYKWISFR